MSTSNSRPQQQLRSDEAYAQFFDDLYHMGRPAEIFEAGPAVLRKMRRSRSRGASRRQAQRPRSGRRAIARQ
jgi:hypothetical protein